MLHSFENNNIFTGSFGSLRYKITPHVIQKNAHEINAEESSIKAEYWYGLLSYEYSEIEGEKEFPMSETGRQEMQAWLTDKIREKKI